MRKSERAQRIEEAIRRKEEAMAATGDLEAYTAKLDHKIVEKATVTAAQDLGARLKRSNAKSFRNSLR